MRKFIRCLIFALGTLIIGVTSTLELILMLPVFLIALMSRYVKLRDCKDHIENIYERFMEVATSLVDEFK